MKGCGGFSVTIWLSTGQIAGNFFTGFIIAKYTLLSVLMNSVTRNLFAVIVALAMWLAPLQSIVAETPNLPCHTESHTVKPMQHKSMMSSQCDHCDDASCYCAPIFPILLQQSHAAYSIASCMPQLAVIERLPGYFFDQLYRPPRG